MELLVFVIALFVPIALGVPIALSLIVASVALMFQLDMFSVQVVAENLVSGANNFSLMAIPFFILAGELMNAGGITRRIIDLGLSLVGHRQGGMGYVAIIAAIIFASLSGSAVADTVALGAVLIPLMLRAGYDRNRSTGLIASGGVIAGVIPPSIPLILFGVTSGVSISKLFLAGVVPGLLMGLALIVTWWLVSRRSEQQPLPRQSLGDMLRALRQAGWALLLPVIIVGGLRFGIFTPTEAGVVAAFYALFVSVVVYRELSLADLFHVFVAAARMTSIIMLLVAASSVSAWMMTMADIPMLVADMLSGMTDSPLLLLLLINLIVLVISMTMDLAPVILILTPVLMPVITQAGIDPVYFGIIFIINLSIGLLTPPVGTVLAAAASVGKTTMGGVLQGMWPFLLAQLVLLTMLILFPQIVLAPLHWMS
ncbi:TRAP transporter large permease [Corticimicrobacter populi]|uniref:TRAP transporter large permease protein n=1 Tax=Corticimicrobacter populi TaxID=2175229 RepID=A0A2V1JXH0_9BURK|nr:L-dehydroascorbate transporter large permease subunit [Corticimicrobacter populi]QDQ89314.1 TRAP transporter large permease subunit [Alcaligenaceae bacterium SJ-26]